MAVIDYKCKDCGESFFKIVNSQAERDSVVCPKCGGKEIKQVFGGTAYITAGKKAAPPAADIAVLAAVNAIDGESYQGNPKTILV